MGEMNMKLTSFALATVVALAACGTSDQIDSNEQARRAYLGLDGSIAKSIKLGFDGFNMASSANIMPQTTAGTAAGTITVTGQVDQGSSSNKGMRLNVGMVNYTDGNVPIDTKNDTIHVIYNTSTDTTMQPYLEMMLKSFPNGTVDGMLNGDYTMSGDLKGTVTLSVTFSGTTMDGGGGTVVRVPGSTHVTGTATTANNGVFDIDVTI
jgi:hypothetical protein